MFKMIKQLVLFTTNANAFGYFLGGCLVENVHS